MEEKFDVYDNELVDIIIKRAKRLYDPEFYLELETTYKIAGFQSAVREYVRRFEQYKQDNPDKML